MFATSLLLTAMAVASTANSMGDFAKRCGTNAATDLPRLFLYKDGKTWKEIHAKNKHEEIEVKNDTETLAQMFRAKGENTYLLTDAPVEDYETYQQYCFAGDKKIIERHFEFRTAWGWGYESSTKYDKLGKPTFSSKRFFDTNNEKTINQPEDALDNWLKPKTYIAMNELPFWRLWESKQ